MRYLFVFLTFFILTYNYVDAQYTLSGGCGVPITPMQPIGTPTYGGSNGNVYANTILGSSPMNCTSDGIWCATETIHQTVSGVAGTNKNIICSTRNNNAGVISNTNLCGLNYIKTKLLVADASTGPAAQAVNLQYNLCDKYNISGGTILGGSVVVSTSTQGNGGGNNVITAAYFRLNPDDSSVFLSFISQQDTVGNRLQLLNGPIFSLCLPFNDLTSTETGIIFVQSGTSAGGNVAVWSVSRNTGITFVKLYTGYVLISIIPGPSSVNRLILYQTAPPGAIVIANYNTNTQVLSILDSISLIGCPPSIISGSPLLIIPSSSPLYAQQAYLYTICYPGESPNTVPKSAVYEIGPNGATPYALFIRSKILTFQFNYRTVFSGVDQQIMITAGTSLYQHPQMYCVKDPWNPSFIGTASMISLPASSTSPDYFISSDYGVTSSCFKTTFFGMNQISTSQYPVYMEYCGSGVFNNASFCNGNSDVCCPNLNCVPPSPQPTCGAPATSCTFGSQCQSGNCVNLGNKPDGTTCFTPTNKCQKPYQCVNGTCTPQGNQPNGFLCGANATFCKAASQCVSGTCIAGANTANGTVCGRNATSCRSADTCIAGSCVNGTNAANNTICGANATNCTTGARCINGVCQNSTNVPDGTSCGAANGTCFTNQTCMSGVCQPSGFAPNTTVCGTTPVDSCGFTQICDLGFCVNTSFVPNGTTCGPVVGFCQIQPVCIDYTCQPIENKPNTTLCGLPATECYTGDYCLNGTCVNGTNIPDNTTCGAAQSECNTGSTCQKGICTPGPISANGTLCGPNCTFGGTCESGICVGATVSPDGTVCGRNETACMNADVCISGNCTIGTQKANLTSCGPHLPDVCQTGDICINGACQNNTIFPDGTTCTGGTPPTPCTTGNVCIYNNNTCSQNANIPDGTQCGNVSATNCTTGTICISGTCNPDMPQPDGTPCGPNNTTFCETGDVCVSGTCQNNTIIPDGTPCGPVGDCQQQAYCNNGTCPLNPVASNGTACNVTSVPNLCLNDGYCDGVNLTCNANGTKPVGTVCFIELPNSTFILGVCDVYGDCVINATDGNFTQDLTNIIFSNPNKFHTSLGVILAIVLSIAGALGLICCFFPIGFIGNENRKKIEEEVKKQNQ